MRVEAIPVRAAPTFSNDPSWSPGRRTPLASITMLGGHSGTQQSPTMGGKVRRRGVRCRKAVLRDFEFAASFRLTKEQAPESLCTWCCGNHGADVTGAKFNVRGDRAG